MEEKKDQIDIELNQEIADGIYSNLAIISHSNSEFIIDFIRAMPGVSKARVKSRIILTPEHAKRLLFALQENINKFEQSNGRIILREKGPGLPDPALGQA
jgi:hypothetical protein